MVFFFIIGITGSIFTHSQVREKNSIVMPSGAVLHVEVAKDDTHRALGLMHRKHLPKDTGMLFVFRDEKIRSFWMKNTHIPLSIAFLNKQGIVVKITDMKPLSQTVVSSDIPSQYAIEVNKGAFLDYAVVVGTKLSLPNIVAKE